LLDEFRLVTVTGPGGVGKTRLVAEVARAIADRFADGVWLAELAPVTDAGSVSIAVADALGLQLAPGAELATMLGRQQLLLVLDNCEHVLDAAARLCEEVLAAADDVRVLTTSREPLGIVGEARYRLAPLPVSVVDGGPARPAAKEAGPVPAAVALFADRARLACPGFALDETSGPVVAKIIAQLDGIPLAIELAAARVEALGLDQLAARLNDQLAVLGRAGRSAAAGRHASMVATGNWSYRLLDAGEQRVFRALSVFPGPFTLDAAEAVAGQQVAPTVLRLVDCSMVVPPRLGPDGRARYLMLETLRAFGAEQQADAGERPAFEAALAGYVLNVAEQAAALLEPTCADELTATAWLRAEDVTAHHVLAWSLQNDPATALRLALALAPWWYDRARRIDEYQWLSSAVFAAASESDSWCEAQVWLSMYSPSVTGSLAHADAVVDALAHKPPIPHLARARAVRAGCLANLQRDAEAMAEAERALALAVDLGDAIAEVSALMVLGHVAVKQGDFDAAMTWLRRADHIDRATLPGWLARAAANEFSSVLVEVGQTAEARRSCDSVLAMAQRLGCLITQGSCLLILGSIDVREGELAAAREHIADAFGIYSRTGSVHLLVNLLFECQLLCVREQRWHQVVTIHAAWNSVIKVALQAAAGHNEELEAGLALADSVLGSEAVRTARQLGGAMMPDAAAGYALQVLQEGPGSRTAGPPLSARERELVVLVAQGRTDAQIASQLFISVRTVRSHLDRIRDKTGCRRRADLTRLAVQAGLI
jgi:predicted ATPase/DNA-binding CsgD family transcriptional regulator